MQKVKLLTVLATSFVIFSCGGGSESTTPTAISEPTQQEPVKLTSTITGKIENYNLTGKNYIVAVSFNQYGMPVRELEPINPDGTFTMELDKNKEYVFFIQNDKNEYIVSLTDGMNNIGLVFDSDNTDLQLNYNGTLTTTYQNVVYNNSFNTDNDNDNIPFFADFTEINQYFGYKVFFDDTSANSMSIDRVLNKYEWGYMHYLSYLHSVSNTGITSDRNSDPAYFIKYIYCVNVQRNWSKITKEDRKINGKIFKRIEGVVPVYIRDDVDNETRETLLEAIDKWNTAFKEIGADSQIKLYYAGEVVENKYFYNAINNNWRGIYIYTTENSNTTVAGRTIDNAFWNDIDDSFQLADVDNAMLFTILYPIDEWKPRIDNLMSLYPDGVFYVEYTTDSNGNLDYGAVITNIGKPMRAIAINSYYSWNSFYYEWVLIHEIGHALHLFHPFGFEVKNYDPSYQYINDMKGKESVMNYLNYYQDYPGSYEITQFDKDVLKYVYEFSTPEEITIDNVSEFLKTKCGF